MFIIFHAHFTFKSIEIVEFTAEKFNSDFKSIDYINLIVKPQNDLDYGVRKMTALSEISMEYAVPLNEAVKKIIEWASPDDATTLITWTDSMLHDLKRSFEVQNIEFVRNNNWIALNYLVAKRMNQVLFPRLKDALNHFGLDVVGTKGVSQYDCENIANLFLHIKPTMDDLMESKPKEKKTATFNERGTQVVKKSIKALLFDGKSVTWENIRQYSKIQEQLAFDEEEEVRLKEIYQKVFLSKWYYEMEKKLKKEELN